jgi:hypothetical protein
MPSYSSSDPLREHMLEGHVISLLEANLIFGVQSLTAEIGRIKRDGFSIKSRRVSMTKILLRTNKFAKCTPPADLPHKEILMTEYWIET